jgi:hypothetical protein
MCLYVALTTHILQALIPKAGTKDILFLSIVHNISLLHYKLVTCFDPSDHHHKAGHK